MSDGNNHPKMPSFNTNSAISLGLLVIVCGGIWQLSGILSTNRETAKDSFNDIKLLVTEQRAAITVQQAKFDARFDKLEMGIAAGWSTADMERWVNKLAKQNPQLTVPEVERHAP